MTTRNLTKLLAEIDEADARLWSAQEREEDARTKYNLTVQEAKEAAARSAALHCALVLVGGKEKPASVA